MKGLERKPFFSKSAILNVFVSLILYLFVGINTQFYILRDDNLFNMLTEVQNVIAYWLRDSVLHILKESNEYQRNIDVVAFKIF